MQQQFKYQILTSLLVLLITMTTVYAQNFRFEKLTKEDGLSQSTGNETLQDSRGFIWFATQDGLNRYDGYHFKVYRHNRNKKNGLAGSNINDLLEDTHGNLWIANNSTGLNKLNLEQDTFTSYRHDAANEQSLASDKLTCLALGANEKLWIGTRIGVDVLDLKSNTFKRYRIRLGSKGNNEVHVVKDILVTKNMDVYLGTDTGLFKYDVNQDDLVAVHVIHEDGMMRPISFDVNTMIEDRSGLLWLGTEHGVIRWNVNTNKIRQFIHNSNDIHSLSNNEVLSMIEDASGKLWIGTEKGLNYFDKATNTFRRYYYDRTDPYSLSSSYIMSLYQDKTGIIWIGTLGGGINKLRSTNNPFNHIKASLVLKESISSDIIWKITKGKNGDLWYGTNEGLVVYNEQEHKAKIFKKTNRINYGPLNDIVYAVHFDHLGNLWVGTAAGLSKVSAKEIKEVWSKNQLLFEHFNKDIAPWNEIKSISSIYEDPITNLMWIGTLNEGLIQMKFNSNQELASMNHFLFNENDSTSISSNRVNAIQRDKEGEIWIGTDDGFSVWQNDKGSFRRVYFFRDVDTAVMEYNVDVFYIDESNSIWVGNGEGLYEFNEKEQKYTTYSAADGLPNNNVYGILGNEKKSLWISTNQGISVLNQEDNSFRNYDVDDGLQSNEFNWNSYYKDSENKLYFGGINGITAFNPSELKIDPYKPNLAITRLRILNKPVLVGTTNKQLGISDDLNVILKKDISGTDTIQLSHRHSVVSLEFAAMHYASPKKNQYKYMLSGFDKDWVYTNSDDRKVTYTNLDAGDYTFKVLGANSDGVWATTPKTLFISIKPPFWRTWWFLTLTALTFAALAIFIFKVVLRQQLLEKKDKEKTAMLKEIHHRVKNNLQVVNSLLKLQSRELEDERIVAMFKEAQNRVLSMALLHEKMYRSDDLEHLDVRDHITLLIEDLVKSYSLENKISVAIDIDYIDIGLQTSVPLGLVINEIITNALKYAFPKEEKGTIKVVIKKEEERKFEMIIGDDGVGAGPFLTEKGGLGTKLIKAFTKQLRGSIQRLEEPGTVFKIIFYNIDPEK